MSTSIQEVPSRRLLPAVSKSASDEVEGWLAAVALAFDFPESRRWMDPDRIHLTPRRRTAQGHSAEGCQ